MTTDTVTVCDGKYTVINDNGKLRALRYGEPWRDLTGDNLVYWLMVELQAARGDLADLRRTVAAIPAKPLYADNTDSRSNNGTLPPGFRGDFE